MDVSENLILVLRGLSKYIYIPLNAFLQMSLGIITIIRTK